jgi:energy-converting hydrogenase A subunit M
MENKLRRLTVVEKEVTELEVRIKEIVERELLDLETRLKALLRERTKLQRWELTQIMKDLLSIIIEDDYLTRDDIVKKIEISDKDYTNNMTSLRRRGLIVNVGTRANPLWCADIDEVNQTLTERKKI